MASISWHHIQSFDSRIGLLERSMQFRPLAESQQTEWKALLKRLKGANTTRNRIVHGYIDDAYPDWEKVIKPSDVDLTAILRKRSNNPEFIFNVDRLKREGATFLQLGIDLSRFRETFNHGDEDAVR